MTKVGDPVDVASGQVLLEQVDVELPAPLTLERLHLSSYRAGLWFGPSWTSSVDQRLEVDSEDVCYFSPDGMILTYPQAAVDVPVLPVEGPRWPLTLAQDGTYTLASPDRELRFGPLPGRGRAVLPVSSIIDRGGDRVDVDYDDLGAPRLLRHSRGYRVELRTHAGRVTGLRVLEPGRETGVLATRFGYDPRGRLTQVIDSSGAPQVFDYDPDGRITGWQDRNGHWYRYVYDAHGRCVRTVGDQGFYDGTFSYDPERRITAFTNSLGDTTEYHLNEAHQVVRMVDQLGNTTTSQWDRYDRLLSRTDPLGRTTSYEYTPDGELVAIIRPDGSRAPAGGAGVTGSARPGTQVTELDLFGRPRTSTDRAGRPTRFGWTVEGKPLSRLHPSGARELWRYDREGNEIEHVGMLGQVTRHEYGPFDLMTASVDATGARTTYEYDTELRLTAVTNPNGLTWRYTYDAAGRVIQEVDFDSRETRFAYDAAGQLTRQVNAAGETIEYGYDLLGRVVERRTAAETTTYTYDEAGRLLSADNGESRVTVERDPNGQVTAHRVDDRTVSFRYDERNLRIHRRTPSGVESAWSFDEAGRPTVLDTDGHTVLFGHDEADAEVERRVGALILRQSYDPEHRLAAQVALRTSAGTADAVVSQRRYDYRADGRLVGLEDADGDTVRFELDPADRVTAMTAPNRVEYYRYSASGTISASAGPGQDGERRYHGTLLAGVNMVGGAVTYHYDVQGRLTRRQERNPTGVVRTWHYAWNVHDRLTMVTTPDGVRWRYRYDPLGRRIAKQRLAGDGSVVEQIQFTWDGTVLVEQERIGTGIERQVVTWAYHPSRDHPVAQYEQIGTQRRFRTIMTDMIGTPVELLDERGTPAWRSQATLWGKDTPGAATPLRFPGQYADDETGLHYNVYRYYDPATGRYISQDPLGLAPAPDPMAYVANPHSATDPLGLTASCSPTRSPSPDERKHDDSTNASDTGSNKKQKQNHAPGDTKPVAPGDKAVADIVEPGGKPIGKPGSSPNIRMMSEQELDQVWHDIVKEYGPPKQREIQYKGENKGKIEYVETPDGGRIQLRDFSKSGGKTIDIDINIDGVSVDKIHRVRQP